MLFIFFTFLAADIGHLNSIYEGVAGDIPVRVIVKTPGVVPGLADINIRVFSDKVHKVTARPIYWHAGEKGAPPADIAYPVKGENNLYSTQRWLMEFGSYNVQVKLYSGEEVFEINIPVNSLALDIKQMEGSLEIILLVLMLLLIFGAVNIITISDRKSTRLNSSHKPISYAVFCLKKKKHKSKHHTHISYSYLHQLSNNHTPELLSRLNP